MADPIPMERPKLAEHITNEPDIRDRSQALTAKMGRINRVLNANAALPEMRQQAKDELAALAKDALNLWSVI